MKQETKTVQGIVDKIKIKDKGWAILINEIWYNNDDMRESPEGGQKVELEYWTNPKTKFNNVIQWKAMYQEQIYTNRTVETKDRKIIKQSCLKCASTIVQSLAMRYELNTVEAAHETIRISEIFVKYIEEEKQ
jgi:hypothetical protein